MFPSTDDYSESISLKTLFSRFLSFFDPISLVTDIVGLLIIESIPSLITRTGFSLSSGLGLMTFMRCAGDSNAHGTMTSLCASWEVLVFLLTDSARVSGEFSELNRRFELRLVPNTAGLCNVRAENKLLLTLV